MLYLTALCNQSKKPLKILSNMAGVRGMIKGNERYRIFDFGQNVLLSLEFCMKSCTSKCSTGIKAFTYLSVEQALNKC